MRWLAATALLALGTVDVVAALLWAPSTWAVFVADPERAAPIAWVRALFALGPGVGIALALWVTCAIGAGGVALRQAWGRPLGGILVVLHLPWWPLALPAGGLLWNTPEVPSRARKDS